MKRMQMVNGFDWRQVVWSRHDAPRPSICSYCRGPLPDVPLTMWRGRGDAVSFCDECVDKHLRLVDQ